MTGDPFELLFGQAIAIGSAAERDAFLDQACPDPGKRKTLGKLVADHFRAGAFLRMPALATPTSITELERPGAAIGAYKLREVIGEGGFGVVYLAEQQQPVRRNVALKILKPGMDTRHIVARFEMECQALAAMDHPHIAKVLDAGETATGRPFFVMELVSGLPITEYCDQAKLPTSARLELFADACQAVQHAHHKGIIHRDLKPSNILVAEHDGRPLVKVIDFGIAKATGGEFANQTVLTGVAQVIGTPLYMSPEQAGQSRDIDVRSDVYSLGVVLYELLTGTTPFQQERLRDVGCDEIRRIIREEEPPKPSTRMSTLSQDAATVSANRQSEPKRLKQMLRGDLDWIVMKCLEKDRNRRYDSASALATDLQRYLHDEPVMACPPSAGYRLAKLVRRNRIGLSFAGLVLLVLLVLTGGIGWNLRDRAARKTEAELERAARAAEAEQELQSALVEAERLRNRRNWTEAREAVKRVERLLGSRGHATVSERLRAVGADLDMVARLQDVQLQPYFPGLPAARKNKPMSEQYGAAFRDYGIEVQKLGLREAGERIRESAIREDLVDALDDWFAGQPVIRPRGDFSSLLTAALKYPASYRIPGIASLADPDDWRNRVRMADLNGERKTLEQLADERPSTNLRTSTTLLLARALGRTGAKDKALEIVSAAQQQSPTDLRLNVDLAERLQRHKPPRYEEAIAFTRAALAVNPDHPALCVRLADLIVGAGRPQEAVAIYRRAAEAIAKLEANSPSGYEAENHLIQFKLGEALSRRCLWAEAESAYQRARNYKPEDIKPLLGLAWVYRNTRAWDNAVAILEEAHRLAPASRHGASNLAWLLATHPDIMRRDPRRALELAEKATDKEAAWGQGWNTLGVARYRAGDWKGAIAALEKGAELSGGGSAWEWLFLAMANQRLGEHQRATHWLGQAHAWIAERKEWLAATTAYQEEIERFYAEAIELGVKRHQPGVEKKNGR